MSIDRIDGFIFVIATKSFGFFQIIATEHATAEWTAPTEKQSRLDCQGKTRFERRAKLFLIMLYIILYCGIHFEAGDTKF